MIKQAALTSDRAVVTIGRVFGEGKDRDLYYSYMLQEREVELLRKTADAFHAQGKKVTVILNVGGVVEMASWQDLADAILLCWQPGEEGGHSVASALSGEVNPSGRLPMTISRRYEDEPSAANFPRVFEDKPFNYSFYRRLEGNKKDYVVKDIDYTDYAEDIYVGYRYFGTKARGAVAYPFGYGLSYTSFRWSDLKIEKTGSLSEDSKCLKVSLTVTNTGKRAGKDVVELYVKAPGRSIDKPERELKAFAKTPLLEPGQSCTVQMTVPVESLASWENGAWSLEKGRYRIIAARNASDKGLRKALRL